MIQMGVNVEEIDFSQRQAVDAGGFRDWLFEVCPELDGGYDLTLGGNNVRAIHRAIHESKHGTLTLDVADRICVALGLHIDTDLPEHLWRPATVRGPEPNPTRDLGIQLLSEGRGVAEVARHCGVSTSAVRAWRAFVGLRRVA
jgi:hypothetical protein